jgi:integrase
VERALVRGSVVKRRWKDGKRFSYAIKYVTPDGRQKLETVGPNKKEAERVLAERIAAISGGTYAELREATFAEFAKKWLAHVESRLKPSTRDGYERYIRKQLVPEFGRYPLRALNAGLIQAWMDERLAEGSAPKTVNNYLVVMKKMLGDGVTWGYLAANPAGAVRRAKVPHQEMQALAPEQVRRFLAAVAPDYWLFFTVAVFTGLRRGELIALQWGDVDRQAGRLHVRRSLWKGQFIGPKTRRSIRSVDLAPQVLSALCEARPPGRAEVFRSQLIFSGPNGKPLDPDNLVKRRFLPALERAELPRIRFHDLRHTYASLLIAAGEHPKYIQSQLGHASITTTLDRYGHLLPGAYEHGGKRIERTVLGEGRLPRP